MPNLGKYIVIEGHDGTGKSTQVGLVREKLKSIGIHSIEFHEPEGTPIATAIRTVIKNGNLKRDGITNLLLFSAARHDIWYQLALPALREGTWVIASRNYYSTIAYQGYGEGLNINEIIDITKAATDSLYLHPDKAFILNLDDESERLSRIAERGELQDPDTFESKSAFFQSDVKNGYLHLAQHNNIPIISASQSIDDIHEIIWNDISSLID